ncbi:hypothetical protein IJT10_08770 [bacterium]|nr:hypothetical protein [bacterium]
MNFCTKLLFFAGFVLSFSMVGCSNSGDETGSISFKIMNSGSPAEPNITIPENTKTLKLELFLEPAVTGKAVSFVDSPYTDSKVDKVDLKSGLGGDSKKNVTKHTYYSVTADFNGGEPTLELDDVTEGEWIVRVSALDSEGKNLAYYQDGFNVSSGSKSDNKCWLNSGSAPEGYIYASNTSNGTMTRFSLYSHLLETCKLNTGNPAYLFAKSSEPSFSDTLYASTGSDHVLSLVPNILEDRFDVEKLQFPNNGAYAVGGSTAVVSFYNEGLVRFFDYEEKSTSYDYCSTGSGADYISRVVDSKFWVCNKNSKDLSHVSLESRALVRSNTRLGNDVALAAEPNSDDSKIWLIGTRSGSGFVRAIKSEDTGGTNWGEFTTALQSPEALYVDDKETIYVTDNGRGELVVLDGSKLDDNGNIKELFGKTGERMKLPGGGEQILSDGDRLYILQRSGAKLVEVDLHTKTIARSTSLGSAPRSILHVK